MQYLFAALVLAPLSGFLWAFFLRWKHTPRIIPETVPGLSLRLSHSGGMIETLTLPAGRIRCGFSPDFDIDLTHYIKPGRTAGKVPVEELAFQLADARLAVTAHSKVMMNGVERTSGSIPANSSLLFKTCRFTFLGQTEIQMERSVYPGASALRKLAAAPAAASLAAVMLLVLGLVDLGTSGYFERLMPKPAIVVEQQAQPWPATAAVPEPAPAMAMPEPAPAMVIPDPAPVPEKKPVVVPLRSAVRLEPIKPVPERKTAPAMTSPIPAPAPAVTSPEPALAAISLDMVPVTRPVSPVVKAVYLIVKPVPKTGTPVPPATRPVSPVVKMVFTAPRQTTPAQQALPGPEIAAMLPSRVESRLKPEPRPIPVPESRPMPTPYPTPRMIKPGETIPDKRVDVLFIHAHPDDESLDYGALMALCREAGLTTATVLLTDGEGGIYQQEYTGPRDNIVSTRIQEATRAMQFLGSSIYIRLGLKNNPYNSLLERKGVDEVLRLWDGDAVTARLAGIINTLGPKVLVSPEGPSYAREHFEHEATGVLTLMALQRLRLTGGHLPEAHLVSIDPRQKDAYTGLISFPRQQIMERQRQALLSHATQADATYFGIQIIEKYSDEYYLIRYWDSAIHFSRFFGLAS